MHISGRKFIIHPKKVNVELSDDSSENVKIVKPIQNVLTINTYPHKTYERNVDTLFSFSTLLFLF